MYTRIHASQTQQAPAIPNNLETFHQEFILFRSELVTITYIETFGQEFLTFNQDCKVPPNIIKGSQNNTKVYKAFQTRPETLTIYCQGVHFNHSDSTSR